MVCVDNAGFDVSLERRKIYVALPDAEAKRSGLVRVIDESGEDYLYPMSLFAEIRLTPRVAKAIHTNE